MEESNADCASDHIAEKRNDCPEKNDFKSVIDDNGEKASQVPTEEGEKDPDPDYVPGRQSRKRKKAVRIETDESEQELINFTMVKKPTYEPGRDRIYAFNRYRTTLKRSRTFEAFRANAESISNEIHRFEIGLAETNVTQLKYDLPSLELYPIDFSPHWIPYKNRPDGNCLYRAASQAVWGNEEGHTEMRIRVAIEMAVHEDKYLDSEYLSRGMEEQNPEMLSCGDHVERKKCQENMASNYCQYLSTYKASKLTKEEIQHHYR